MKKRKSNKILLLDCDHKNALAIVRHLGSSGKYQIDGVSLNKTSLAFYSKYISRKYVLTNPHKDPSAYTNELLSLLADNSYSALIPVSYLSNQICAEHKDQIQQYTHVSIADPGSIKLASSKIETYKLAGQLGIPYPEMIILKDADDLSSVNPPFPCVIKAPFEAGRNLVEYAHNSEQLLKKYQKMCKAHQFTDILPIIQRFVVGGGYGFFAYYEQGICKNFFMHKRIREYPVTGGASTVAESFHDEILLKYGTKILDYLNWNGVAMVEFKKDDSTGQYLLMEINAKFWGSLDLALECGVNFPEMLIDKALGKEITTCKEYPKLRFQWILNGDLFTVFERPWYVFSFITQLFRARNDIWFTDIKPNLFQILYIPVHYFKKWFK